VTASVPPSPAPLPAAPSDPAAEHPDDEATSDPGTRWGAGAALLALLATFGVTLFVGIPALIIGEDTTTTKVIGTAVSSVLQNAAFVGIPLLILALLAIGRLRRRDFGLWLPPRKWVVVGLIVAAFVAYLLLAAGLGALLGIEDEQDDLPEKLGAKDSLLAGMVIAFCVTVFAPIGEEFLLRGVLFPGLRNSIARFAPVWIAVIVAAVIDGLFFGALHIAGSKAIFLPVLATFGVVLCLLYQFSGTLYAPIALHATNNTIAMTTALGWKFQSGVLLWIVALASLTLLAVIAKRVGLRVGPIGREASPRPTPDAAA
jgi:membrane protease YdiL (CAAX protease family)